MGWVCADGVQERREDTRFELAHFRKQMRKSHKSVPAGGPPSVHAPPHKADAKWRAGQDSKNVVAKAMGGGSEGGHGDQGGQGEEG